MVRGFEQMVFAEGVGEAWLMQHGKEEAKG